MLSIPVSFGGFFASLASQPISQQVSNNDFNNMADGSLSMNSFKITNLATPTEDNDATTKKYVDEKSITNITDNQKLNSHRIWFNTNNTSRINSIGNYFEIVSPTGIFLKAGNVALLSALTSQVSFHDKQLKHLAAPTEDDDAATKKYVDNKTKSISNAEKNLDMNSFEITNLPTSTEDTDAATKAYVDGKTNVLTKRYSYQRNIKNYKPTFWLSSTFPFGFDDEKLTIQELTETGITITGGAVTRNLSTSVNIIKRSTAIYGTEFTFFVKAKRTSAMGRIFTASTTNKLLGWWNSYTKCAWMDGNIYDIAVNRTNNNTSTVYTFILVNNADNKKVYQDKTEINTTLNGADSWNGNIVLGKPTMNSNETGDAQFYEVGFDKVLTKAQIDDIYDRVLV